LPVTISLLGFEDQYMGIKVVIYKPNEIKENGMFLLVDQSLWELTEDEKAELPKKRKTKRDKLEEHFHLPGYLNKTGFTLLFNSLKMK
jgi:hypothetical protein